MKSFVKLERLERKLEVLRAAEGILRKRLGKMFNFNGSCRDLLREIKAIEQKMAYYRMEQKRQKEVESDIKIDTGTEVSQFL